MDLIYDLFNCCFRFNWTQNFRFIRIVFNNKNLRKTNYFCNCSGQNSRFDLCYCHRCWIFFVFILQLHLDRNSMKKWLWNKVLVRMTSENFPLLFPFTCMYHSSYSFTAHGLFAFCFRFSSMCSRPIQRIHLKMKREFSLLKNMRSRNPQRMKTFLIFEWTSWTKEVESQAEEGREIIFGQIYCKDFPTYFFFRN